MDILSAPVNHFNPCLQPHRLTSADQSVIMAARDIAYTGGTFHNMSGTGIIKASSADRDIGSIDDGMHGAGPAFYRAPIAKPEQLTPAYFGDTCHNGGYSGSLDRSASKAKKVKTLRESYMKPFAGAGVHQALSSVDDAVKYIPSDFGDPVFKRSSPTNECGVVGCEIRSFHMHGSAANRSDSACLNNLSMPTDSGNTASQAPAPFSRTPGNRKQMSRQNSAPLPQKFNPAISQNGGQTLHTSLSNGMPGSDLNADLMFNRWNSVVSQNGDINIETDPNSSDDRLGSEFKANPTFHRTPGRKPNSPSSGIGSGNLPEPALTKFLYDLGRTCLVEVDGQMVLFRQFPDKNFPADTNLQDLPETGWVPLPIEARVTQGGASILDDLCINLQRESEEITSEPASASEPQQQSPPPLARQWSCMDGHDMWSSLRSSGGQGDDSCAESVFIQSHDHGNQYTNCGNNDSLHGGQHSHHDCNDSYHDNQSRSPAAGESFLPYVPSPRVLTRDVYDQDVGSHLTASVLYHNGSHDHHQEPLPVPPCVAEVISHSQSDILSETDREVDLIFNPLMRDRTIDEEDDDSSNFSSLDLSSDSDLDSDSSVSDSDLPEHEHEHIEHEHIEHIHSSGVASGGACNCVEHLSDTAQITDMLKSMLKIKPEPADHGVEDCDTDRSGSCQRLELGLAQQPHDQDSGDYPEDDDESFVVVSEFGEIPTEEQDLGVEYEENNGFPDGMEYYENLAEGDDGFPANEGEEDSSSCEQRSARRSLNFGHGSANQSGFLFLGVGLSEAGSRSPSVCYDHDDDNDCSSIGFEGEECMSAPASPVMPAGDGPRWWDGLDASTVSESALLTAQPVEPIVREVYSARVTPRNRGSLFGSSAMAKLDVSSSSLENCVPSEDFFSLFDVSKDIGGPPSLREVLFNSVTSYIVVMKSSSGTIVSINEQFQRLIGIHEKVVGQNISRFIKVKSAIQACHPRTVMLKSGNHRVSGKLVWCVTGQGSESPVSMWQTPLRGNPHLTVCVIDDTISITAGEMSKLTRKVHRYSDEFVPTNLSKRTYRIAPMVKMLKDIKTRSSECLVGQLEEGMPKPRSNSLSEGACRGQSGIKVMAIDSLITLDADGAILDKDNAFWFVHFRYLQVPSRISEVLQDIQACGNGQAYDQSGHSYHSMDSPNTLHKSTQFGEVDELSVPRLPECEGGKGVSACLTLPRACFLSVPDGGRPDLTDLSYRGGYMQASTPYKAGATTAGALSDTVTLRNGCYSANLLHHDGSAVPVYFKVGSVRCKCGGVRTHFRFCLWLSPCRPKDACTNLEDSVCDEGEAGRPREDGEKDGSIIKIFQKIQKRKSVSFVEDLTGYDLDLTSASHLDPCEPSLGQLLTNHADLNKSCNSNTEDSHDLDLALTPEFLSRYHVGESMGQGSFGFVRRATSVKSRESCVVKFVKKVKMHADGWTTVDSKVDHELSLVQDLSLLVGPNTKLPLEVAILLKCQDMSPFIVKMLDFSWSEHFIHIVMEDVGCMDLFDFIDQVNIDENLAKHIFIQIAHGVDFLSSLGVLHRDIKDENVVISNSFQCKLIDFGSAALMLPEGQFFSEFRGTKEYCSPEVRQGFGYKGPEQEIWAMGITLFTMMFSVNPYGPQEMIEPLDRDCMAGVSDELQNLLLHLLTVDPYMRIPLTLVMNHPWCCKGYVLEGVAWEDIFGPQQEEETSLNVDVACPSDCGIGSDLEPDPEAIIDLDPEDLFNLDPEVEEGGQHVRHKA